MISNTKHVILLLFLPSLFLSLSSEKKFLFSMRLFPICLQNICWVRRNFVTKSTVLVDFHDHITIVSATQTYTRHAELLLRHAMCVNWSGRRRTHTHTNPKSQTSHCTNIGGVVILVWLSACTTVCACCLC